jgi:hypothetical protein
MVNNFFPRKSHRLSDNVEKYGAAKHTIHDSITQRREDVTCMPSQLRQQYEHTLILFNTYCFLND